MHQDVWDILGIEATTDERAIKRAYAAKLKLTPPEVDPAGYMKLREAYETAKKRAQFQQQLAAATEEPEEPDEATEAPAAATMPEAKPSWSAQQQAFAELHALLAQRELDGFLQKVTSIQAAQLFATLDEHNDFIGAVACLVLDAKIEDGPWRGHLASLLGARDHENIFPRGTRYWYAYNQLLASYTQLRATATDAHIADQRDIAVTPGYLHVYHVLTGPFDAERLSALTRSQAYHRLAQQILERARLDSSIVIPAENREWWDRTAMAGQHRPVAEPTPTRADAPQKDSGWGFTWAVWPFLIFMVIGFGSWSGNSSRDFRIDPKKLEQYQPGPPLVDYSLEATAALDPRLARCDSKTRRKILLYLSVSQPNSTFTQNVDPNPLHPNTTPLRGLHLDTNDPIVAQLLEKCDASKLFDENGMLRKLPE